MTGNDRVALFESVVDIFLSRGREGAHVVLTVTPGRDEYVQFRFREGCVVGEVGSRQWIDPERPLTAAAVAGLAILGFTGGGAERNYARDHLPGSASELAGLAEMVLRTAYELEDDYAVRVTGLDLNDVALPRVQAFARDMIATHLRDSGVPFLRDQDGDFRVDITGPGGRETAVWFIAEGDGGSRYRIAARVPWMPASREEALERCNEWNGTHNGPRAFVTDSSDGWQVVVADDVDLSTGCTPSFVDQFSRGAVASIVEFWGWSASAGATSGGGRALEGGA